MDTKILRYEGKNVVVSYDVNRCIHAAECVRRSPQVFDPKSKPWISPNNADADELLATIGHCPTGALHLDRQDGGAAESADAVNSITVAADGPLYLRGRIKVLDGSGTLILEDTRVALCRCGESKNKPLCDGSHERAKFEDAGDLSTIEREDVAAEATDLEVVPATNGPFLVRGSCVIQDAFGDPACSADGKALCRCGHSNNKPFCDGSHKRVGFQDGN